MCICNYLLKNIVWGYCKKANVSHIERHQRDLYEGVEIWLNILITGRNKYYIPSKFLEITLFAVTSLYALFNFTHCAGE